MQRSHDIVLLHWQCGNNHHHCLMLHRYSVDILVNVNDIEEFYIEEIDHELKQVYGFQ